MALITSDCAPSRSLEKSSSSARRTHSSRCAQFIAVVLLPVVLLVVVLVGVLLPHPSCSCSRSCCVVGHRNPAAHSCRVRLSQETMAAFESAASYGDEREELMGHLRRADRKVAEHAADAAKLGAANVQLGVERAAALAATAAAGERLAEAEESAAAAAAEAGRLQLELNLSSSVQNALEWRVTESELAAKTADDRLARTRTSSAVSATWFYVATWTVLNHDGPNHLGFLSRHTRTAL